MFTLHKLQLTGPRGSVELTGAEATLLQAFQGAPNARLSHEQVALYLGVSGTGDPKAVIQVRLVRLRKKMYEAGAEGAVIESIRNLGYQCFEPLQVQL